MTGVTPYKALFGVNSRIPLDVIFPSPPGEDVKWPQYVQEQQSRLQEIYSFLRKKQSAAIQRATAYQSGRITKAAQVATGGTVYYFSPRVIRIRNQCSSKKLALLWTGPYAVI